MSDLPGKTTSPVDEGPPEGMGGAFGPRVHPTDYVRVLYRRRWTGLIVLAAVVLSVAVYCFSAEPVYEAQAQVLIDSEDPHIVTFQEVIDEGQAVANYYQTQYELLRGRALARRTVEALQLWTRPGFDRPRPAPSSSVGRWMNEAVSTAGTAVGLGSGDSGAGAAEAERPADPPSADAPERAFAVSRLLAGLQVVPVRASRIVYLRFRAGDPELAAAVVNAHARQFIEQNLEFRFVASKEATAWLSARLEEERRRVERSEAALQAYREEHDEVSLEEGQDIVVQKLADLNEAVTRAKTLHIEQEARYRQLLAIRNGRMPIDSFPAILSNPFIQQLKSDLARLQREHAELSQTLGERHPNLVEKRSAIDTTEARLQAEIEKVVQSVLSEFRAARAEEASLTAALEEQKAEALQLNRRGIEYGVLKREAESVRQVYESLLQRAKETGVSGELRASNIRLVDPAIPPRAPVSPRTGFNLLMALLSGSVLAVGFAFLVEHLDDRLKTPDDVRRGLGVPFLALIPEVSARRREPPAIAGRPSTPIVTNGAPPSFAEAVRGLRTNLLFSGARSGMRTVVVTSTAQGEGKTLVAANLAIALARAQRRVLLVDGDLRRPGLHELFGAKLEPGLSNVLGREAELTAVLQPAGVADLKLIAAGTPPPDGPELLGSPRFEEFLQTLHDRFDWVILDSPPLNAVTDATVLAHAATGVVFVVGAEMSSGREARQALEQLQRGGGRVVGAVLNRVQVERHAYYYAPYYNREYVESYVR